MQLETGGTATVIDKEIQLDLSDCDLDDGLIYLTLNDLISLTELLEAE